MSQENPTAEENYGYKEPSEEKSAPKAEVIPENVSSSNESNKTIENIESKTDKIEKQFNDVGGIEGITNTLSNMSQEDKTALQKKIETVQSGIAKREDILKNGNQEMGSIDSMWELTTDMAKGQSFTDKPYGFLEHVQKITGNASGIVIGLAMLPAFGPLKGIQDIGRKIKLGFEKRKLKNLQKKAP